MKQSTFNQLILPVVAAFFIMAAFGACAPLINALTPQFSVGTSGVKTKGGWEITLRPEIKGAVIASEEEITSYSSVNPCRQQEVDAGKTYVLACNAPNLVSIVTKGTPVTRTLEVFPVQGSP